MLTRLLINQCQIITFLILKYDIIENSRIELTGIVLPVQVGGLLGGGAKGMLAPSSQIIGGPGPPWPPPLPTPMIQISYRPEGNLLRGLYIFENQPTLKAWKKTSMSLGTDSLQKASLPHQLTIYVLASTNMSPDHPQIRPIKDDFYKF